MSEYSVILKGDPLEQLSPAEMAMVLELSNNAKHTAEKFGVPVDGFYLAIAFDSGKKQTMAFAKKKE